MTKSLKRISIPIRNDNSGWYDTTDVRQSGSGDAALMDNRGAGDAKFLLVGFVGNHYEPYNGVFRSYLLPAINDEVAASIDGGWEGVKLIRQAYLSLFTRVKSGSGDYPRDQSYFETGSDAKVQMRRLTKTPTFNHNGDGLMENISPDDPHSPSSSHWSAADYSDITSSDWSVERWEEYVSPNTGGETRIRCTSYVGAVAPAQTQSGRKLYYANPDKGAQQVQCGGLTNHGVVLRSPNETIGDFRAEFWAARAGVDSGLRPKLTIVYEPFDPTPDPPRAIGPKGVVHPDFGFEGYLPVDEDNDTASVTIQVRSADKGGGDLLWDQTVPISWAWPDGTFLIENPGQPTLPSGVTLYWRAKQTSATGRDSGWTGGASGSNPWTHFTIDLDRPIVTPQSVGNRVQSWKMPLRANWETP